MCGSEFNLMYISFIEVFINYFLFISIASITKIQLIVFF